MFDLPWSTHRYFIESVSGCPHPKTFLSSRFVKFVASLTSSHKINIRYLVNLAMEDKRTLCGRTLERIRTETGCESLDSLTPKFVKEHLQYFPVPVDERWRVGLLTELLKTRRGTCSIADFNLEDIARMINDICSS